MKWAVFGLVFLMFAASAMAASVGRDMPARVAPGEAVTVTFNVGSLEAGKSFTLEDDLPDTWKFTSWEVTGSTETKDKIDHRVTAGNRHGWSFTATGTSATIKYVASAPSTEGAANFDAVYFDSAGQGREQKSVVVRTIKCGDNVCEGAENSDSCVQDCPKPAPPAPQPEQKAPEPEKTTPAPVKDNTMMYVIIAVLVLAIVGAGAYFAMKKK